MLYDVIIIGAGVVGGAIARELSRYNLSVMALEKEIDVSCGISKANTGIIHSPSLVTKGTRKAQYALRGNLMFKDLCRELGVEIQWPGALILAYSEEDKKTLEYYKTQGEDTRDLFSAGDGGYRYIEKDDLLALEPSINSDIARALLVPDAGRVIPYELTIALWENAIENGVELKLNEAVQSIEKKGVDENISWTIQTNHGEYGCRYVINAAGHGSNDLGLQAGFEDSSIDIVKGQYLIYNRNRNFDVNHILFQVPQKGKSKTGKGILVCKTVYGNLMIGPDAQWLDDSFNTGTDLESLQEVLGGAQKSIPLLDEKKIIKTFAGLRPKPGGGDFIIDYKNHFVHLCGIESPGLTSSPAIAEDVMGILKKDGLELIADKNFSSFRKPIVDVILNYSAKELKERVELSDSDLDQLVCRCEQVPRSRILDAMSRGIPVKTLDGIKRRTRAGQGQCQGAFCGSRVKNLLSKELNVPVDDITQRGSEDLKSRVIAKDFL